MAHSPALTITVHLANRCVHVYDQDPEEVVVENLARIEPERVFTDTTWTIGGPHHVSTFLTRQILRVELRSPHLPAWPFAAGLDEIRLVSFEDFESRANEVRRIEHSELQLADGGIYESLAVLEDSLGGQTPVRALGKSVPSAIRAKWLSHLLEGPCLHVRKSADTSILFNTANLAGVFSYPGLPERPSKAIGTSTRLRSHRG